MNLNKENVARAIILFEIACTLPVKDWDDLTGGVAEVPLRIPAGILKVMTMALGPEDAEKWMQKCFVRGLESFAEFMIEKTFDNPQECEKFMGKACNQALNGFQKEKEILEKS